MCETLLNPTRRPASTGQYSLAASLFIFVSDLCEDLRRATLAACFRISMSALAPRGLNMNTLINVMSLIPTACLTLTVLHRMILFGI